MAKVKITALVLIALSVGATLLAGCGGSSKPAYCSSIASLESSIKALPTTNVITNGVSALETAVAKVQSDAESAVSNAKSDFPSETSAVTSSVDALSSTIKKLTSSPSAAAVAQVPGQISAVVSSVDSFRSATSSKCS